MPSDAVIHTLTFHHDEVIHQIALSSFISREPNYFSHCHTLGLFASGPASWAAACAALSSLILMASVPSSIRDSLNHGCFSASFAVMRCFGS